ncbi:I78 family peptidase inhibitor [Hyphobacterium marinum]|uniref:I78 family peptidase inhibitor n=1 Tax=Hyphobacterium marinum TaxID=3116574 RepID=A0ABU7M0H3_9PROT|nr:I78 family peptidase inhibitor [Hyphobacterium sp. Y6023]MEE2567196.1 I78 family peptidase inhibitor [Hyphobacterium sp. Y6023]
MRLIALASFLALAACATMPEDPVDPVDPDAPACAADSYQHLVGQPIGEVDTETLPHPTRVVPHGVAVTMEYRADRMTVWLDRRDHIERVQCG